MDIFVYLQHAVCMIDGWATNKILWRERIVVNNNG